MKKLENKVALIPGGTRGIGRAIAEKYLDEGARVVIAARDKKEIDQVLRELKERGEIDGRVLDVSIAQDVERVVQDIVASHGRIDVLVNAAGVYGSIGRVTEVRAEEWLSALQINLGGAFLTTHFVGKVMESQGDGVMIQFVGGGEGAYPSFTSYVSAKGGVARFVETVAKELAPYGVRVNAIAPGAVNTKFLEDILAAGPERVGKETYEKSLKQKESGGTSPEKAADLAVYLASSESVGLTGKVVSAVWDKYENFSSHMKDIASSDVYNFRRIRPEDRGFDWEK